MNIVLFSPFVQIFLFPSFVAISTLNNADLHVSQLARADGATVKLQRGGFLRIYESTHIAELYRN